MWMRRICDSFCSPALSPTVKQYWNATVGGGTECELKRECDKYDLTIQQLNRIHVWYMSATTSNPVVGGSPSLVDLTRKIDSQVSLSLLRWIKEWSDLAENPLAPVTFAEIVHLLFTFCTLGKRDLLQFIFAYWDLQLCGTVDKQQIFQTATEWQIRSPSSSASSNTLPLAKLKSIDSMLLQRGKQLPYRPSSYNEREEANRIDFETLEFIHSRAPYLLWPMFSFQFKLQLATLGHSAWKRLAHNHLAKQRISSSVKGERPCCSWCWCFAPQSLNMTDTITIKVDPPTPPHFNRSGTKRAAFSPPPSRSRQTSQRTTSRSTASSVRNPAPPMPPIPMEMNDDLSKTIPKKSILKQKTTEITPQSPPVLKTHCYSSSSSLSPPIIRRTGSRVRAVGLKTSTHSSIVAQHLQPGHMRQRSNSLPLPDSIVNNNIPIPTVIIVNNNEQSGDIPGTTTQYFIPT